MIIKRATADVNPEDTGPDMKSIMIPEKGKERGIKQFGWLTYNRNNFFASQKGRIVFRVTFTVSSYVMFRAKNVDK